MRSIKKMLKEQELVVGLTIEQICAPWVAKVYADAGADFVFIENEHMFFNPSDLQGFVLTCRLCDLPVVAKCSYVDRGNICKLLEAGVTGIQLPMSETAAQLADVVRYTKFPPLGSRAACPGVGNTKYEPVNTADWLKRANEESAVIAHIETRVGMEKADDILSVPGVDLMFIGSFDLSISLGHPAQYEHPDVVKAMERLVSAARAHNVEPGMWAPSFEVARPWIKRGVRFFEESSDLAFIARGATELIRQFPGHGPRVAGGEGHF